MGGAVSQWEELGVDTATHWGYTETRLRSTLSTGSMDPVILTTGHILATTLYYPHLVTY